MKTKRRHQLETTSATAGAGGGLSGGQPHGQQQPQKQSSGAGAGAGAGLAATPSGSGLLTLAAPSSAVGSQISPHSGEVQRSMNELSKQLRAVKDRFDSIIPTLESIERAKQKIEKASDSHGRAGSPSGYARSRLRSLLTTALNESKNEATLLQSTIALCNLITREAGAPHSSTPSTTQSAISTSSTASIAPLSLTLGSGQPPLRRGVLMALLMRQAEILPVWVPPINDPDDEPPPLCGAEPVEMYFTAKPGDMVAAKVRSEDADDTDENWILAEVSCFNQATSKYEVVDIDAEEGKKMHVLSRRRVIPLPVWRANPHTHPYALFPPHTVVLALYPQTTCFYKGVVDRSPRRVRDPYQILFEDENYPDGFSPPLPVAQRYVICYKEDKSKGGSSAKN